MSDSIPPVASLPLTLSSLALPPYETGTRELARLSFLDSSEKNLAYSEKYKAEGAADRATLFLELAGAQLIGASACADSSSVVDHKLRGATLLADAGAMPVVRAVVLSVHHAAHTGAVMTAEQTQQLDALARRSELLATLDVREVFGDAILFVSTMAAHAIHVTQESQLELSSAARTGKALDAAVVAKLENDAANGRTFAAAFLSMLTTFGTAGTLRTAAALASYLYFQNKHLARAQAFMAHTKLLAGDFATPDAFLPGSPYGDTILDYLAANGVALSEADHAAINAATARAPVPVLN